MLGCQQIDGALVFGHRFYRWTYLPTSPGLPLAEMLFPPAPFSSPLDLFQANPLHWTYFFPHFPRDVGRPAGGGGGGKRGKSAGSGQPASSVREVRSRRWVLGALALLGLEAHCRAVRSDAFATRPDLARTKLAFTQGFFPWEVILLCVSCLFLGFFGDFLVVTRFLPVLRCSSLVVPFLFRSLWFLALAFPCFPCR